jgi:RNA polymerase sigma-70 factor (ECF subfamily)
MSVINDDDLKLLRNAANFDQTALAEIYDRYQAALYRYAFRLLGDDQLAEDCIAETFYRFLKNLRKGGLPNENLRAYLYRIAHNWITDHYRKAQKIKEQELDNSLPGKENPVETVTTALQSEQLRASILSLTPEQQQAVILRYFEDWSNEEIAGFMGKRVGAVKALLHRSLTSLRKKCNNQEIL